MMSTTGPSKLDSREVRIGRILSEIHDCRAGGMALDDAKILAENPDIADELQRHLATLREVHRADHTIDSLIRQGILAPPDGDDHVATLGPYKILCCIGRGGMGVVLEAHDEALRRRVAIKLLRPDLTDDSTALARFQREARAAAAVSHENILTVNAVGEHHGSHYIVMQRIAGPSLADVIRDHGPLPANFVRAAFQQLLEGLGAAHAAGLIHRDIKPANLMFDVAGPLVGEKDKGARSGSPECGHAAALNRFIAGKLKITDFGLARVASSQTRLTLPEQRFGTPQYMSPEQARGDADIDHRTDLYSAGVVLYEMLTGRTPFSAETPTAVVHQILANAPKDPRSIVSGCDPVLASIALRLMAKRREDRFGAASDVQASVESGRPVARALSWSRYRVSAGVMVTVALLTGLLLIAKSAPRESVRSRPSIVEARRSKESTHVVEVRRRGESNWEALENDLHLGDSSTIANATHVDLLGDGNCAVAVAGASLPGGLDLVLLDSDGQLVNSLGVEDDRSWPDCSMTEGFVGRDVTVGDLDGVPGDEIVFIAGDRGEYPTVVMIIDPRTWEILAKFWHMGHIGGGEPGSRRLWIQPNFLGDAQDGKKPAIAVRGFANKLDGFYERAAEDSDPWTAYDVVQCVMVLDPRRMVAQWEAIGPPATGRVALPPSDAVFAYAYLDLSSSDLAIYHNDRVVTPAPSDEEIGVIESFDAFYGNDSDSAERSFVASVSCNRSQGDYLAGARLLLARDLTISVVDPVPMSVSARREDFWRARWRIVVRNYVLQEPARDAQSAHPARKQG